MLTVFIVVVNYRCFGSSFDVNSSASVHIRWLIVHRLHSGRFRCLQRIHDFLNMTGFCDIDLGFSKRHELNTCDTTTRRQIYRICFFPHPAKRASANTTITTIILFIFSVPPNNLELQASASNHESQSAQILYCKTHSYNKRLS